MTNLVSFVTNHWRVLLVMLHQSTSWFILFDLSYSFGFLSISSWVPVCHMVKLSITFVTFHQPSVFAESTCSTNPFHDSLWVDCRAWNEMVCSSCDGFNIGPDWFQNCHFYLQGSFIWSTTIPSGINLPLQTFVPTAIQWSVSFNYPSHYSHNRSMRFFLVICFHLEFHPSLC